MKLFIPFLISFFTLFPSVFAFAAWNENQSTLKEYPLVETTTSLNPGESLYLNLDRSRFVQKLKLSTYGRGGEALFEVVVNGEVKGTIHVPRRDPDYIVTIADVTENITLKHKSGATVVIMALSAYVTEKRFPHPTYPDEVTKSNAARISSNIILNIKDLEDYPSSEDSEAFLLPVKVWAGRAYASATASGDLSARVRQRLAVLLVKMNDAEVLIDKLLKDDNSFYLGVEFLSLKEELEDLIN